MNEHSGAQADRGLISAEGAAAFLSISPRHLFKLIRSGALPSVRIGRRRLVRPTDLQSFIESRVVGSSQGR
jgi:excisionase family DNA binding protein